jgi:hypothetical protein
MTSIKGRSKDKGPPPEPTEPDEGAADDFIVAKLALWAGDFQTAEALLTNIAPAHTRGTPRPIFEHPVLASAQRLLAQLRRRMGEYRLLAASAALPNEMIEAVPAMQSRGTHLRAVIWVESDRQYELRCYVCNLAWEREFYTRGARLSQVPGAAERVSNLGYGVANVHPAAEAAEAAEGALEIGWGYNAGEMFLQPELSDFCTCTVRALWIANQLPETTDPMQRIYQEFLDTFDPP